MAFVKSKNTEHEGKASDPDNAPLGVLIEEKSHPPPSEHEPRGYDPHLIAGQITRSVEKAASGRFRIVDERTRVINGNTNYIAPVAHESREAMRRNGHTRTRNFPLTEVWAALSGDSRLIALETLPPAPGVAGVGVLRPPENRAALTA